MKLKNKIAVVTGAGGGLGQAVCRRFAEEGAKVVLVDLKEELAKGTSDEIKQYDAAPLIVKADVTQSEDVQRYVDETVQKHGRIDIFFNNAGIEGEVAPTADYDENEFDQVIAVNLKGVFLGLKHVLKQMEKQRSGSIINTSSIGGLVAHENFCAYVASKHGVTGLTKTAAIEYGKKGIRINAICPGPIDTDMVKHAAEKHNPDNPQEYYDIVTSLVPSNRIGQPKEIGSLVTFLASDEAPYINGAAIPIDGAMTAV